MAYEYGKVKIQLRRDTAANLASVVLANGEPAYATDTEVLKIGNGSDNFASLSGIAGGGGGGGSEVNDLSSVVTWTVVPTGYISEESVTQHSGALIITESQIVDLGNYVASGDNISQLVNDTGFLTDIINDTSPQFGGSVTTTGNRAIIIDASSHDESASILIRGTGDGSATDSGLLIMKNFGEASDDAYIWNYSNSKIIFATNGIGNVKIDENGQLGVNVVGYNPEYTLDVRGSGRIRSNLIAESLTIYNSFTLPTGDGTDGQVLTTDGSGNVNWESAGNPLAVVSDTGIAGGGSRITNMVSISSSDYSGITPDVSTLYFVTG